MSTNKENKQDKAEKKELTPQQIQQRKKMLIYPLFFLVFAGAMWLILAPSGDSEEVKDGFNIDLPMPKDEKMMNDKKSAYEREAIANKKNEKMRNLQDFAFMLGDSEQTQEEHGKQIQMASIPGDYQDETDRSSALQSSANAYRNVNNQLSSWYSQPTEEDDQAQLELEWRLQELERKLEEKEQMKSMADEKLELMEKSLQMASKYMPAMGMGQAPPSMPENQPNVQAATNVNSSKAVAQPVKQVRHNVVSILAAPISDAEFREQYSKPRNMSFNTAAGRDEITDKNTIKACVNQTITITDGNEVQLRLLEAMQVGNMIIPSNTVITATAKISGERMDIIISSIQYAENIVSVNLSAYDLDGQPGVFIPGSMEMSAVKEIAANAGGNLGSSINISQQSAGQQLLTDLGRGAIQGTSQYIAKKMREVKITLKSGYKVLLLSKS